MSYYLRGTQVWNHDHMWQLLKAAGDVELPALTAYAFGQQPPDAELLADLRIVRERLGPDHDLAGLVDGAIAVLKQRA